jgi:hypothetical protein
MSSGRVNHFFSEGIAVGSRYRAAGHSGRQTWSLSRVDGSGRPAPGMIIISGTLTALLYLDHRVESYECVCDVLLGLREHANDMRLESGQL